MTTLILSRVHAARQTLGALHVFRGDVQLFGCVTLELPWENNERYESCIPEGRYAVEHRVSGAFGHHLHVKDVPNRSHILIHAGNYVSDTEGCILVGNEFEHIDGDGLIDVTYSTQTLKGLVSCVSALATLRVMPASREQMDVLPPRVADAIDTTAIEQASRSLNGKGAVHAP
jgi:hypothetical protein